MSDQVYNLDFDVSGGGGSLDMDVSRGAGTLDLTVNVGGDISAILAEKWAVGKARGVPVPATDITYQNNAKWYTEDMARILNNARVINYVVCGTPAATGAKTVTVDNWVLEPGAWVCIRFVYTDEAFVSQITLNVSDTGARQIYYNGSRIPSGYLNRYNTYLMIYDGEVFQVVGMHETGRDTDVTIGKNSLAYGSNLQASGDGSQAFGSSTHAGGNYSHAQGYQSVAGGRAAHAEGTGNNAAAHNSHAEGIGNIANSQASHVSGKYNVPGGLNTASDWASGVTYDVGSMVKNDGHLYHCIRKHISGRNTGSFNVKEYNDAMTTLYTVWEDLGTGTTEYAEIVGNGTSSTRSNARTLDWAGNERLRGDLYVGCETDSSGGSKVVSEAALAAMSGAASGFATLDSSGHVPAAQLPSYVDDVVEYASTAAFPATGETGKIYVALDTGKVYRWAGSTYAVISDYVHPAYTARTGKPAADQTPAFGGTFVVSQVESDAQGHVTAMTDRTVTIPSAAATANAAGLMSATDKAKLDLISEGAAAIDDTAGAGDDDVTWSADKLVDEAFCIETGVISSLPMTITDSRITEECTVEDFVPDERVDLGWVTEDGKLILYGSLPSGTTMSSKKLRVHRVHGLTSDLRTVTLREVVSSSENGNYLVAEAKNLIPGVQYSFRLYSVEDGEATYVTGVGTITHYPSYNMWFQQVPRGLVDGTVYKVTVGPTVSPQDISTSNTVTFEAADLTPEEVSS